MDPLASRLGQILRATPWLWEVLEVVRDAGPAGAFVAAGAIRNTVWDSLCGVQTPPAINDIDVVFHDPAAATVDWPQRLDSILPGYRWDVANQATIHTWQSERYGRTIQPYKSLPAALESWPETATAVGARIDGAGALEAVAPYGLEDLFALVARPSPGLLDPAVFQARVRDKGWARRWPALRILDGDQGPCGIVCGPRDAVPRRQAVDAHFPIARSST